MYVYDQDLPRGGYGMGDTLGNRKIIQLWDGKITQLWDRKIIQLWDGKIIKKHVFDINYVAIKHFCILRTAICMKSRDLAI